MKQKNKLIFVLNIVVLKITFLGTGTSQGIPVIGSTHPVCLSNDKKDKRLRCSVLIEINHVIIVIDCGPDFRQQMLRAKATKLDAILFTHEHADHTAGLDDIRPFFFKQGDIPIYAHARVLKQLQTRFAYIFETENKYPGAPSVTKNTIENKPFTVKGIPVTPINGMHHTLQVFGFKIANFAYVTDMNNIDEDALLKLKSLDVLVLNALRVEPHVSHFNLEEALHIIKLLKPKKAYLTHISHLLGFHEEVEKALPKNVYLAYDELTLHL